MRELYTSLDSTRIGFYRSVLEAAGIACYIQNDATAQLANMLAMVFQPTLCIVDDERYEEALALLRPYQESAVSTADEWTCPACKESNPDPFELCWNCQSPRPDPNAPTP